jgi:hypothetical protein
MHVGREDHAMGVRNSAVPLAERDQSIDEVAGFTMKPSPQVARLSERS